MTLPQCSSIVNKNNLPWLMQNMKLSAPMTADGGSSPMVKPKGDKQVEYLDLDLDSGKSTPPRKVRIDHPPHPEPFVHNQRKQVGRNTKADLLCVCAPQMKSNGTGMAVSDERVDYVVVDQQRTQALKSTREAWNDGRQSTETDTPSKGPK